MVPLFTLSIWCIYRLGRALYSKEIGLWAALLAALWPKFFVVTGQFRRDDLWSALWLGALVVLVEGKVTLRRGFVIGVLLGVATVVSLKTVLLLLALAIAFGFLAYCQRPSEQPLRPAIVPIVVSIVAGICSAPSLLTTFYFSRHGLPQLWYGTVSHNYVPQLGRWKHSALSFYFCRSSLDWEFWQN